MYSIVGEYEKSMEYLRKNFEISQEIGDKRALSIAMSNMALNYHNIGNFEKSREYYEKAIDLCRKLKTKYLLCSFLNGMAKLLFDTNEIMSSIEANDEAIKIAKEIKRHDILFECEIQNIKIMALKNKQLAIDELLKLFNIYTKEEQIATINYELFKITKKNDYKIKANLIYKSLYKQFPKIEYKNKIDDLEKSPKFLKRSGTSQDNML
jgi:tetratricopeptide (TPR) repeat protein